MTFAARASGLAALSARVANAMLRVEPKRRPTWPEERRGGALRGNYDVAKRVPPKLLAIVLPTVNARIMRTSAKIGADALQ